MSRSKVCFSPLGSAAAPHDLDFFFVREVGKAAGPQNRLAGRQIFVHLHVQRALIANLAPNINPSQNPVGDVQRQNHGGLFCNNLFPARF